MRAAVYARLSAKAGDDVKDSVPQQVRDGKACVDRMGWTLVEDPFVDESISAWDGGPGGNGRAKDRPSWTRILELAKADEVDVVVARHVDRLLRNPRARSDLRETGLRVADHSGNLLDDFALGILAEVATKESDVRSERQLLAEQRRVAAGRPPRGGHRHFGYTRGDHRIVPEEAEVLREVADRWLAGETLRGLARDLNERGIPTTRGNEWTNRSLAKTLRSPRLAGIRVHNGTEARGDWEPIFGDETHARLIALAGTGPNRRAPERYLLTGLVECGACGHTLNGKRHRETRGGRRYACLGCHRNGIGADPLEESVWNAALGRTWERDRLKEREIAERLREVQAELAADRERLKEFNEDRADGLLPRDEWADMTTRVRARIDDLEHEAKRLEGERDRTTDLWGNLLAIADTYETASPADRRRVLERAVDRAVLAPNRGRAGGRVDLSRVRVEWADGEVTDGLHEVRPLPQD